MGSKAPLGCRPTSRHLSLTPAYRELRTGAVEPSSSPVWPRGTRALASEEPRPLMFYFRWLGCPHCGPILDAGAWRHTSTPDRSRRPPRRIWMRKITATGGGQVAQDEGTLLIGINLGVASGCNHGLAHGTWDHAFKWAQRHHWVVGLLRATCRLHQPTANCELARSSQVPRQYGPVARGH